MHRDTNPKHIGPTKHCPAGEFPDEHTKRGEHRPVDPFGTLLFPISILKCSLIVDELNGIFLLIQGRKSLKREICEVWKGKILGNMVETAIPILTVPRRTFVLPILHLLGRVRLGVQAQATQTLIWKDIQSSRSDDGRGMLPIEIVQGSPQEVVQRFAKRTQIDRTFFHKPSSFKVAITSRVRRDLAMYGRWWTGLFSFLIFVLGT